MLDVTRYAAVPRFSAVYFRRTYPQLTAPDGLWDLSLEVLPLVGAEPHHGDLEWTLPAGGRVLMRHLQHEKNKYDHQGAQYAVIYLDELTHFTEGQFWYLMSRNRTTSRVRPNVRAGTNPDPDHFCAALIDWWIDEAGDPIMERSGVLRWFVRDRGVLDWAEDPETLKQRHPGKEPLSLTFIAARLDDNPALLAKDPGYRSRLDALNPVERARLLGGNWKVRPAAGMYFKRHMFQVFDSIPGHVLAAVRGWDKAATEVSPTNPSPDWTRGVKLLRLKDGAPVRYLVEHVASIRGSPNAVDILMRNTASQDGSGTTHACWVDPGQAGKVDEAHIRTVLDGHRVVFERASKSKEVYAGPLSSQVEGGMVGLLRGPWNEGYLLELEAFPEGAHDDQVDGSSLAYLKVQSRYRRASHASPEAQSQHRI